MIDGVLILGQCDYCTRYQVTDSGLVCDAFPDGIPESIIAGLFDHREQFADEELLFELKPGMEEFFAAWVLARQDFLDAEPVEIKPRVRRRPVYRTKE